MTAFLAITLGLVAPMAYVLWLAHAATERRAKPPVSPDRLEAAKRRRSGT